MFLLLKQVTGQTILCINTERKENKTSLMYQPFLERQVVNFLAQHLLILLQNQVNH